MNPYLCPWETTFWFISDSVPTLLYYSHVPAIAASILVAILVVSRSAKIASSYALTLLLVVFSIWSLVDIFLWSNNQPELTMFWWSIQILTELVIYSAAFILVYVYIYNTKPQFRYYLLLATALLPAIILMPTNLYLTSVTDYCSAEENPFIVFYTYAFEVFTVALILIIFIRSFIEQKTALDRKRVLFFAFGIIFFLSSFASGNIIGSVTGDWELAQYGLFGMPVFIAFLAYLIVRFKVFNIKLIGAQALVVSLWFLVGSLMFVAVSQTTRIVAGVTLLFTTIAGYLLVRSVKKEVKQREEIQELAKNLQVANDKLKVLDRLKSEFVSIASHQLRSPLTAIRGYASMLAEGSYGKLPTKAQDISERIAESSKYMALSVEDYLNVSRIEAGNMKYEKSDFNLKEVAERIVDELRPVAMKKGLVTVFRSDCSGSCSVHADIGKTRQIVMNLLDNSMKYTPKGSITVVAHDDVKKKKMFISIQDTGIGMSKETAGEVFEKFVRAKNANSVNTTGTGLGLYIAKKMINDMGGNIIVESEGEGKGSTFTIEFPLLPGNQTAR